MLFAQRVAEEEEGVEPEPEPEPEPDKPALPESTAEMRSMAAQARAIQADGHEALMWLEIWARMAAADNGQADATGTMHRPPDAIAGADAVRCAPWLLLGQNWIGNLTWTIRE